MPTKLFIRFAALLAAIVGLLPLPHADGQSPAISGTFSREHPSRFDSDIYSVEKKLLEQDESNTNFLYRLTFRAQRDMTNIMLMEILPPGVTLLKATPTPDRVNGNEIFWRVPILSAGTERSMLLSVRTETGGTFITRSQITSDTTVTLPLTSDISAKLQITKTCPEYAETNEIIPYKITVFNAGMQVAKNVRVMEIPPPTLSMGNFDPNVGDLKPGESKEILLTGRATLKGKHVNRVRAFMEGVAVPAEAKATITVVDPPQVNFVKRGGGTVYIFTPITYQIIVRNDGEMPMRNIVVTDKIPASAQLLAASENPRIIQPPNDTDRTLEWKVGDLIPGQLAAFEYTLVSARPLKLESIARVEGISATGKRYDAQARSDTHWKGAPGVLTEVADNKDPIRAQEDVVYRVRVVNQGDYETISARIALKFSGAVRLVSIKDISNDTSPWSVPPRPVGGRGDAEDSPITLPSVEIAPKAERVLLITARGVAAGTGKITVELQTDFLAGPVIKEETTLVY